MQQPEGADAALPADDLEALMVGYQAGQAGAAAALVRSVSPILMRLFVRRAVAHSHVDDLLQETWLRIHRARHTFRPGNPALPWFFAIAHRVRIDHYRRTRRTSIYEGAVADLAEIPAAEVEATPLEDLDALLAPLSPGEREVIEMLKVVGLSLEDVARAMSCSVGAVKQKVHRAYRKLRSSLVR